MEPLIQLAFGLSRLIIELFCLFICTGLLPVTDHQYGTYDYEGVNMGGPAYSRKSVDNARNYEKFRPDDVLVLTFSKAGIRFSALPNRNLLLNRSFIDSIISTYLFIKNPY